MTETLYNLKVTEKELDYLQAGMFHLKDHLEEEDDTPHEGSTWNYLSFWEKNSLETTCRLGLRLQNKDYTKICWGRKTNQELKKQIAKLQEDINVLQERSANYYKWWRGEESDNIQLREDIKEYIEERKKDKVYMTDILVRDEGEDALLEYLLKDI